MSAENYHHGDLRASALKAGLQLLKDRTADDLSLREVARYVGVSATALYRHFPDKEALLNALAHEGVERFAAVQAKAAKKVGGGKAGLYAMGLAYVKFAVENPALFRLLFRNAPPTDVLEGDISDQTTAMRGLRENVAAVLPKDISPKKRTVASLQAWSQVHGLACLILDRQIEYDPALVKAVVTDQLIWAKNT